MFFAADPSTSAREIIYHEIETPTIYVRLNYVTAVYLPKNETIMNDEDHRIHCGNKDYFDVHATGNVLYIRPMDLPKSVDPSTGGQKTDVTISLASGNHMEFLLVETTKMKDQPADLKVFVKESDEDQLTAATAGPKFVPAAEVESLRAEIATKEDELTAARKKSQLELQTATVKEAQSIKHQYDLSSKKGKEDLHPTIYRDDRFTYIDIGELQEAPSVWELKDGKLSKTEVVLQNGHYTIQHLVNEGEIKVGKSSIKFKYSGV